MICDGRNGQCNRGAGLPTRPGVSNRGVETGGFETCPCHIRRFYKTLPGLRMPLGSSVRLSVRISS